MFHVKTFIYLFFLLFSIISVRDIDVYVNLFYMFIHFCVVYKVVYIAAVWSILYTNLLERNAHEIRGDNLT